jgi:small-conductance mechanosensitive channel
MPWYELVKVVHFMGLIALFGSFVIYPRAGPRLRAATTMNEVRSWLGMLELTRGMFHGGAGMMLLSGVAMTAMRWRTPTPFVAVGMITLLVMWIVFAVIPNRHLRAIRAAVDDRTGPVPADVSRTILNARPWVTMFALNIVTLGVLFEMTLKLGWVGAVSLVVGAAILGAVIGVTVMRRERNVAAAAASKGR